MKKYFLLFAVSSFLSISHAFAQSQATSGKGQAAVVTAHSASEDNSQRGTISRAGKNQQSVYTPPSDADNNTPASNSPASQQAVPAKTQAETVDPKK
jgi:hypothetical protein